MATPNQETTLESLLRQAVDQEWWKIASEHDASEMIYALTRIRKQQAGLRRDNG